jgi:hypothetical protein
MKRFVFNLIIFVFFCYQPQVFATITVEVNPTKVHLGETFKLILSIDNLQESSTPDLRPLENDFTILGTQRSMNYSVINGQTESLHRWIVLLNPKKTGVLPIPSIQLGHQQSMPSSVEVIGSKANSLNNQTSDNQDEASPQDNILLQTNINNSEPYIGQQVIYKVRLYTSTRLLNAQYIPPKVENALLIPLGDAHRYVTTLDSRSYAVEEQTYAVFAQKNGDFNILSPTFEALTFDNPPQHLNVHDKTTTLHVKPIPKNQTLKHWLPANDISLTEIYDNSSNNLKQGDTITRTITLQAFGLPAQLLPTIEIESSTDFNAYTDNPDLTNTAQQDALVGRTKQKVTYLLNKSGEVTIPEIKLHWFNIDTGKEAITTLPARTLHIAPTTTKNSSPVIKAKANTKKIAPLTKSIPPAPKVVHDDLGLWLAAGMAGLWIVTLAIWWFARRKDSSKQTALKRLKLACASNSPTDAQAALLLWATSQWPNIRFLNLNQLDAWITDTDLKQEITHLSQALYEKNKSITWAGEGLWRCVKGFKIKKPKKNNSDYKLPPINPGIL